MMRQSNGVAIDLVKGWKRIMSLVFTGICVVILAVVGGYGSVAFRATVSVEGATAKRETTTLPSFVSAGNPLTQARSFELYRSNGASFLSIHFGRFIWRFVWGSK